MGGLQLPKPHLPRSLRNLNFLYIYLIAQVRVQYGEICSSIFTSQRQVIKKIQHASETSPHNDECNKMFIVYLIYSDTKKSHR